MTSLNELLGLLRNIAVEEEVRLPQGISFPEELFHHDFEMKMGKAPRDFWSQYRSLVEQVNGFDIEGFCLYGLADNSGETNLLTVNRYHTTMDREAPELLFEENRYCIQIGRSSLDNYTYDCRTGKWQYRDRVQYDNLFISCDTLTDFIVEVLKDIRSDER